MPSLTGPADETDDDEVVPEYSSETVAALFRALESVEVRVDPSWIPMGDELDEFEARTEGRVDVGAVDAFSASAPYSSTGPLETSELSGI